MTERIPLQPEESDFEQRVLAEMDRLREKRERLLRSPATGEGINIPPTTEEGLRKMAEKEVQRKIEREQKRQKIEKIKNDVKSGGLTEKELEKIARERLEKQ